MHFPFLVVFLNDKRIKIAVNCHHFIPLQTCNKNIFIFGKFHYFFSRKIFRWCLTFDAVYIYSSTIRHKFSNYHLIFNVDEVDQNI